MHLASDLLGFVFSIVAINLSMKKANKNFTYGYSRAEILGALASTFLIIILSFWLIYEAVTRLIEGNIKIQPWFMFGTAVFGLVCNLSMLKVLHGGPGHNHDHGDGGHDHGHGHSHDHGHKHDHGDAKGHDHSKKVDEENHIDGENKEHGHDHDHDHANEGHGAETADKVQNNANIKAALVHIIGDILQSIGVVFASVVILIWPSATWVDPACTLLFAFIVLFTTQGVIRSCVRILMEAAPLSVDYDKIKTELKEIDLVTDIEDLHVWILTQGKMASSCHILLDKKAEVIDFQRALAHATRIFRKHKIYHSTVQTESPIIDQESALYIDCSNDIHARIDSM